MKTEIERNLRYEADAHRIAALAMMVYSIPIVMNDGDPEAIAVYPGLGEISREIDAIRRFEACRGACKYLLVAGNNPRETTSRLHTFEALQKLGLNFFPRERVHIQASANNALEQAMWLCEKAEELKLTRVMLCVSSFHLLRAYLTTVKTMAKRGSHTFFLIPQATRVSPFKIIPESNETGWNLVPGEVDRILAYQKKGDVATLEDLEEYFKKFPGL